jgi:hypothetical protein
MIIIMFLLKAYVIGAALSAILSYIDYYYFMPYDEPKPLFDEWMFHQTLWSWLGVVFAIWDMILYIIENNINRNGGCYS